MRCRSVFILVFAVLFIGLASASFEFSEGGSSIVEKYQPSETLKADLNISFLNQSLSSNFTDSFGNYIYLNELLEENEDYHTIFFDLSNTSISAAFQTLSFNFTEFQMPSIEGSFNYILSLNGQEVFEKTFEVSSSETAIEEALEEKKSLLNASKHEISTYDGYTQNLLREYLNITRIEPELEYIEENYESLTTEDQEELLNNMTSIKIPTDIHQISYTEPITFYSERGIINLEVLAGINGGVFSGNEQEYLDAIFLWNTQNLITKVVYKEVEIEYSEEEKERLNVFLFTFERIGNPGEAYIIVQNTGDIIFEDITLPIQEQAGYLYLSLNEVYGTLGMVTKENYNFMNFPLFVSPAIDSLTPINVGNYERWEAQKKWMLFGLILFLVLFIGAITYILLQIWYRKKYETYLFKTKNNMYNIMIYIHNSKLKGIPKEEIEKNLKKAGWAKEQISYAMQKYHGKKIAGMIHQPMNIGSQEPKKEIKKNPVKK